MKKSPSCFDVHLVNQLIYQNKREIFSNFCGLFRKAKLYLIMLANSIKTIGKYSNQVLGTYFLPTKVSLKYVELDKGAEFPIMLKLKRFLQCIY